MSEASLKTALKELHVLIKKTQVWRSVKYLNYLASILTYCMNVTKVGVAPLGGGSAYDGISVKILYYIIGILIKSFSFDLIVLLYINF